jgi:protein-S-isoprenylcysteine O-methyltransferase Ste14
MLVVGGAWLVALPALLLWSDYGSFSLHLGRPAAVLTGLLLMTAGGLLALAAGYHLIGRGRGTPLPLDPPQRLVTTGPYAYVRNPQAIAMLLLVGGEIVAVQSRLLWLVLPLTLLYLEVLAGPWEERQLTRRHGQAYLRYRRRVRKWLPALRPYRPVSGRDRVGRG